MLKGLAMLEVEEKGYFGRLLRGYNGNTQM